ncbi:MAG: hypothetical protein LWX01_07475 [Deltaproteobacteria bacterium]|nr:hypothetical protein [Deltaproteobacteria bacterium]
MKRKVCIVTGTRAEYGLLYWLMKEIQEDDKLELKNRNPYVHNIPQTLDHLASFAPSRLKNINPHNSTARCAQDAKHAKKDIVTAGWRRSQLACTLKIKPLRLCDFAVPKQNR